MIIAADDYGGMAQAIVIVIVALFFGIKEYRQESARIKREDDQEKARQEREKVLDAREDAKIERDATAAKEVKTVKETLVETTEAQAAHNQEQAKETAEIKQTGRDNHNLLNGMTTAHLSLIADMAEEAAHDKPDNQVYAARAKQTRQAYEEHVARVEATASKGVS